MTMAFRALERWPFPETKPGERRSSPFKGTYSSTLDLLSRELYHLRSDLYGLAILQVVTRNGERDLRQDQWLRADARVTHPGVAISMGSKFGPLTFHCDRFVGWQANLRAIALGLESLRRVGRYGIGGSGEQYRGWTALPAGSGGGDVVAARQVLR
ncbi:MAG TPA: hypothetical protein VD864_04240, partial [Nocardioides sp.]|nr:hypothetical protein [Nocardioides sp.]